MIHAFLQVVKKNEEIKYMFLIFMLLIYLISWLHHIHHTALQRSHNLQHLYTASKLCINIDDFFDFIFCILNYIFNAGWVLLVCAYVIIWNNIRICLINIFKMIFYLTYLLSNYISSVGWVLLVLAYVRRVHPCTTLSAVGQM